MNERSSPGGGAVFWPLAGGGIVLGSALLSWISRAFEHGVGHRNRPILEVTALLGAMSAVYAGAALFAWGRPPAFRTVLAVALLARLVLLPSKPIQEDDIYRYLWDGKVVALGFDPYGWTPEEVQRALGGRKPPAGGRDASPLARELPRSEAERTILERVNHPHLVTIYPPGLELVFAGGAVWIPPHWPAAVQVAAFKTYLFLFDAGILFALAALLRRLELPAGWALFYGWCPLVLKEYANSGHADMVPGFFLILALAAPAAGRARLSRVAASGLAFGAAVACKFYPLVLLPLLARRLGPARSAVFALAGGAAFLAAEFALPDASGRRRETLLLYALTWENNSFLFFWIAEALRAILGGGRRVFHIGVWEQELETAYVAARVVSAVLVAAAAGLTALRSSPSEPPRAFLGRVFSVLAWTFLFLPVGFPWYFSWAVPYLAFAPRRAWILLPGLLMVYYVRFWYLYNYDRVGFRGVEGALDFFDRVVAAAEYAVFYLVWFSEVVRDRLRGRLWPPRDVSSRAKT